MTRSAFMPRETNRLARENTREGKFAHHTGGWALGSAVAGYCLLPALRYAEPWAVGLGGLLIGWAIIVLYEQMVEVGDAKKRRIWPVILPLCAGAAFLFIGIGGGIVSGFHIDRVCFSIQQELLGERSPAPAKPGIDLPNAADRFQALGCHYQSSRPYSPLLAFEQPEPTPRQPR